MLVETFSSSSVPWQGVWGECMDRLILNAWKLPPYHDPVQWPCVRARQGALMLDQAQPLLMLVMAASCCSWEDNTDSAGRESSLATGLPLSMPLLVESGPKVRCRLRSWRFIPTALESVSCSTRLCKQLNASAKTLEFCLEKAAVHSVVVQHDSHKSICSSKRLQHHQS